MHSFLLKEQIVSFDIKLNITAIIGYVNYHILCSKCPLIVLADTHACSRLRKSFGHCQWLSVVMQTIQPLCAF